MTRIVKAPDVRRSELIACAQKLFYSRGYESTSVSDIVGAAGVAKGTFYYYFESKQAIVEALVDDLTAQGLRLCEAIVTDATLNALQKWTRAIQVISGWNGFAERKAESPGLTRALHTDENVLLQHRLEIQSVQVTKPELAKIIVQGIREGVFETDYPEETAEIACAISGAFSDTLTRIFSNPDSCDRRAALVRREVAAEQAAIERILGATPGSLPIMDEQTLDAWLSK